MLFMAVVLVVLVACLFTQFSHSMHGGNVTDKTRNSEHAEKKSNFSKKPKHSSRTLFSFPEAK